MTFSSLEKPKPGDLLRAFRANDKAEVELLIACGADPDTELDEYGRNLLRLSLIFNFTKFVPLLITANTDLDQKDTAGLTLLMQAAINNNVEAARLLLDKGADINVANDIGRTALHFATGSPERLDMVRLLIEGNADTTLETNNGHTAQALAEKHMRTADSLWSTNGFGAIVLMIKNASQIRYALKARATMQRNQLLQIANASPYTIRRRVQP